MNAETVLEILTKEQKVVVYRRPLSLFFSVLLCPGYLELSYRRETDPGDLIVTVRTLWKKGVPCLPDNDDAAFNRTTKGQFANLLSNWNQLQRERRWAEREPSFGEVVRVVNAYANATGYRLFTLDPGAPVSEAVLYGAVEVEAMHEMTDYDS